MEVFMEQLNKNLPVEQEEKKAAVTVDIFRKEPFLLTKVRQKFGFYGGISLIFGGFFALLFYQTWIGLNVLLFSMIITILIWMVMKKLALAVKKGTRLYFTAVILLAISTCLTSSEILQFFNIVGILLLLDLILLHQFYDDRRWSFSEYILRIPGMIIYSIASLGMPFIDSLNFSKKIKILKNDKFRNILLGMIAAVPILFITTALLSSADLFFGKLTGRLFHVIFSADIFGVLIMVFIGFISCYCILCGALYKEIPAEQKAPKKADATIAVTFLSLLCLVYAVFCVIQIVYLFAGGLLVLPQEFTFAQYARRGFFELLAVTFINIVIILICNGFFMESRVLRLLETVMTISTYIMIASAAYRMLLYIGAYYLSFLRILVLLALLVDALVLAGVILSVHRKNFPLFRYCVVVVSICYVTFSFAKPDYYIATYLTQQKEMLNQEDMRYLTHELSLDAAPAVLNVLYDTGRWKSDQVNKQEDGTEIRSYSEVDSGINESYDESIRNYSDRINHSSYNMGIRNFNYSIYMASKYASKYKN
jgi:hypothetical protein